jgi:demethylmenaquinone methyltransferase/2-methoxy-6-polyprenyl-1,4-benzoquinol methylase
MSPIVDPAASRPPRRTSRSRTPLDDAFDSPETKRRYVARLFDTIADRYDLITVLLSFGRDRHWKARLIDLAGVRPGCRVLDLACGTGDLAFIAARRGADVTCLDLAPRMVELARRRVPTGENHPPSAWLVGDMSSLPIASRSFDVVTTGYGLRNVPDLDRAHVAIRRVLKPGGRLCSLDFDNPERAWLRAVSGGYLAVVGSALGWILHRDPDTYRYIPASIRRYPGARRVAGRMRDLGFTDVRHLGVFGGIMAIHLARRDAATSG